MIKYKCEECGSSLSIKDELAGTDGKCPKCKTPFRVPEPDSGDAPAKKKGKKAAPAAEMSEEDMIFGKDFFSMDDSPATPQRPPAATFEPPPEAPPKKKKKKKEPFGSANPDGDNSAQVASALLSKTGKKNKPSDFDDVDPDEGEGGYDFSAITYLILWRVLPTVLGLGILIPGFYMVLGPMMFDSVDLPPLAQVSGIVRLDGQPVPNATVQFVPDLDKDNTNPGGGSHATSGANGNYKAMYKRELPGIIAGNHTVRVTIGGRIYKTQITVPVEATESQTPVEQHIELKSR